MINLNEAIRQYVITSASDAAFVERFLELLQHPDAYLRTHLPGHITGSVFIVDEEGQHALLVHHAKLNKWLQPGGHADGDTDVVRVALREGVEETGIPHLELISPEIYDLDIHPIPARKDFPAHDHYDVRFLVKTSRSHRIIVSEESHDVQWVRLDELEKYNKEESVLRLRKKMFG